MTAKQAVVLRAATPPDDLESLRRQYGGRIELTGTADAFYERHLLFDNVTDPDSTSAREHYEAVARPSATSSRSDGSAPSRRTRARTPSASTTSRWSSSSAAP